jgi:hypothetical protein
MERKCEDLKREIKAKVPYEEQMQEDETPASQRQQQLAQEHRQADYTSTKWHIRLYVKRLLKQQSNVMMSMLLWRRFLLILKNWIS